MNNRHKETYSFERLEGYYQYYRLIGKLKNMKYFDFIKAVQKMGTGFPIPTLGAQIRNGRLCFFTVFVENGFLYIRNKFGENNPYCIKEEFYYAVLKRFKNASKKSRFQASNYTDPKWTAINGNPSRIYAGYLPALFRELYTRCSISVLDDNSIFEKSENGILLDNLDDSLDFNKFVSNINKLRSQKSIVAFCKEKSATIGTKDGVIIVNIQGKNHTINIGDFNNAHNEIKGGKGNSWFLNILLKTLGIIAPSLEILLRIINKY